MADVQLNWNAVTGQTFKVEYKKDVDATWTEAVTGLIPTTYTINGLDGNTLYNFRVTATCPSGTEGTPVTVNETTNPDTTFVWIEDTFTCEQSDPLVLGDTYTGFSSPVSLFWDETLQRYYVVDADDVNGNVWWFNPNTMTGPGSANYVVTTVAGGLVQSSDISPSLRKIFMAGPDSNGVVVYDIAANSTTTVTTGTNGPFARLFTKIVGGVLYSSNAVDGTIILINPVTNAITSTLNVSSIPGNTSNQYFNNAYTFHSVNGEIWVCAAQRSTSGDIARYNSTLTSFLGEIVIPDAVPPSIGSGWNGRYWQTTFYDQEKNRFYLHDIGSNTTSVIDTTTNSVVDQVVMTDLQQKPYSNIGWNINQLTGQLFASRTNLASPSDSATTIKFYEVDRDVYQFKSMYLDQLTSGLTLKSGTNEFWASNAGLFEWNGGTAWSTDGEIYKYTT